MIKRYSSPCIRFIINVKKDGKSIQIPFDGYDPVNKRRTKEISDPEIMDQMEKSPDFTVYFHLDSVIQEDHITNEIVEEPAAMSLEDRPQEQTCKDEVKKDVTEAKRWLNSLGVPYTKLKNRESVVQEARNHGYNISFESEKQ